MLREEGGVLRQTQGGALPRALPYPHHGLMDAYWRAWL